MNRDIDEFIKNISDNECGKYFESSKKHCYSLIKQALPLQLLSTKEFTRVTQIDIARVASPIVKKINKIDRNRFWILYYRLCEQLISLKCSQCLPSIKEMMCIEYILNRVITQIKKFNPHDESIPFQEVRANIAQISEIYSSSNEIELTIDSKKLQYTRGSVTHYIEKILKRYSKKSMDMDTIEALIENALLSRDDFYTRENFDTDNSHIEKEILSRFNSKKEIDEIIYPLLTELLEQEKFFNYIHNHFINSRFIDFLRHYALHPTSTNDPSSDEDGVNIDDILEELTEESQLLCKLKVGMSLTNREFIKLVYQFDYVEIDTMNHFTDDEHLEIKQYARNDIDISIDIDRKISKVREKLKSDSYINREENSKRVALLKLIFSEEMSAKEMGLVLDYSEKQIYKKIENIKKRINYKKELALCKEI